MSASFVYIVNPTESAKPLAAHLHEQGYNVVLVDLTYVSESTSESDIAQSWIDAGDSVIFPHRDHITVLSNGSVNPVDRADDSGVSLYDRIVVTLQGERKNHVFK